MLRNLNRRLANGSRVFGTPYVGVPGSSIPSTGTHGPGYLYDSLSLPADADVLVRGEITTLPTGLTYFFAREDSSFDAEGPNGAYSFVWRLYADNVDQGTATANFTLGSGGSTTYDQTASLAAAVQQAQAATAGVTAQVQADGSAATALAAAVEQSRTASTAVAAQVQADATLTASLAAVLQELRSASVSLSAQVQDSGSTSFALSAVAQVARSLGASVDANVSAAATATTSVDVLLQAVGSASASAAAVVQASGTLATAQISAQVSALPIVTLGLGAYIYDPLQAPSAPSPYWTLDTTVQPMQLDIQPANLNLDLRV